MLCSELLAEYADVLGRPKFRFSADEVEALITLIRSKGLQVKPARKATPLPDPKDEFILSCALGARAAYLVTGNKRHFPAPSYGSTRVVSAREMAAILDAHQSH